MIFDFAEREYPVYPASGYRTSVSGGTNLVGTNGYIWSSTSTAASSLNSAHLYFVSSEVNPENSSRRALGIPVRCVAE